MLIFTPFYMRPLPYTLYSKWLNYAVVKYYHYTIEVHAELLQKILLAINRLEWFVVDQPPEVFTLKSDAVSQHPHQFISNFLYPLSVPSAA